ncbi:MAG: VanW family protein [Clostridia bacterium]|nr:VanW family protein [Clostridia bacterium]
MSDSRQPHRRRRPQVIQPVAEEEEKLTPQPETKPQEIPTELRRVVVADHDEPDWMVSASRVSGAAERRGAPANRSAQQTEKRAEAKREKKEMPAAEHGEGYAAANEEQIPRRTAAPKKAKKPSGTVRKAAPRKPSKKAIARRNAQIRRTVLLVVVVMALTALIAAGAMGMGRLIDIKKTLDQGKDVFYHNIFVNNIPLEGKTLDEARAIVTQQVSSLVSSWRITLRTQDGRSWDITGEDLKMQYDVADQLDQLWAIGHMGSSAMRYEQVKALSETPVMRHTTLTYDLSSVNQILAQIKQEVDQPPVSAMRINDDSKWPPFSYTDDVPGRELDITGLNEQICAMVDTLQSGVVDLTPTPVEAPVTRKYLEGQIVQLSTYETAIGATSDPGRFINIENGTKRFDKLIIKSGEQVSFNKVAGRRTYSNGYADAPELAYGDYRTGVGGGICQVSSTLYNVVVNAGLEVKTRFQHSLASNYVPLGLDATVQDDRLDFVFKNTTSADIYISTEYYKKKGYWYTKFTIHGRPDPNGYTYKLESEIVEVIPVPEPTYVPDKNAEYVVYNDEMKEVSDGHEGHVVDVYLVTMDAHGNTISREKKYTDTYKALTPKIYVGVTPRETPVPQNYLLMD